jgi:hypothetical protein
MHHGSAYVALSTQSVAVAVSSSLTGHRWDSCSDGVALLLGVAAGRCQSRRRHACVSAMRLQPESMI